MRGEHSWLENGIIKMIDEDEAALAPNSEPARAFAAASSG